MEAYPPEYVRHELPLVLISGLGERDDAGSEGTATLRQESGSRIVTSSPECREQRAAQLLDELLKQDGSGMSWNSTAVPGPTGSLKMRMKAIGRTYTLPPRKAAPLPQSPSADGFPGPQAGQHKSSELHSTLSPLSPTSPIYPDGVFTPLWLAKHQQHVPSLLLAFFNITADDGTSQNEQIQVDINAIKLVLGRSGFKTRFAAVLMSDTSILHAPELEDRLSAMRRATALDSKTGLFFMPPMSSKAEIATFVQSMLTTLQPSVIEYYRDLTKHARRKKVRGAPSLSLTSPAEGGAHSLSTPGWNVRYEFKQGVFAEFRQEMDVAERHYSAAIDELFSSEGILETTPSWSPRWTEARLLCDALAVRVLRCQLWNGLTTGAAISWVNYKIRAKDLVDRRGKGSQTYGWDAWESRWAEVMAWLIQRAALPILRQAPKQSTEDAVEILFSRTFAPPEKAFAAAERLAPFQYLHHAGYWLRLAVQSAVARLDKAFAIPEEDRIPPGQSPASAVAQRSNNYDTYLAPEPHLEYPTDDASGFDHLADIRRLTNSAVDVFASRTQVRLAQRLELDFAHQLAASGRHTEALNIVMPIWDDSSWREDVWDDLFGLVLDLLHDCATRESMGELCLATAWELLAVDHEKATLGSIDLMERLNDSTPASGKIRLSFGNTERLSPLAYSFAFDEKETHVGDNLKCQLAIVSRAPAASAPITLSRLSARLSSGTTITILHRADNTPSQNATTLVQLTSATRNSDGSLSAEADLTISPSQKRVFITSLTFRESGVVHLQELVAVVDDAKFVVEHSLTEIDLVRTHDMYVQWNGLVQQKSLPQLDSTAVTVLPKPPKMQLHVADLPKCYYTDENVHLKIEFLNGEAEAVSGSAIMTVTGQAEVTPVPRWEVTGSAEELSIENLEASTSSNKALSIQVPSEPLVASLGIEVRYALASDPTTALTKDLALELNVIRAFEAKFNIGPLLSTEPWPSFFAVASDSSAEPAGTPQRWRLESNISSSAPEELSIHRISLQVDNVEDDSVCEIEDASLVKSLILASAASTSAGFEFMTKKMLLDDRRATQLELSVDVHWSRAGDSNVAITSLPVPRLTLPTSEPRVLCTVPDAPIESGQVVLSYHLENPSTHFLTFALTMEANDDFAFSGPKYRTLSLTPHSRLQVQYHLLLHQQDNPDGVAEDRWIWPVLQVVDSYYQKNLRVHAGGPRVRVDEKRGLGVLVEEE